MSSIVSDAVRSMVKLGILVFMILYVISPIDLIPEALLGPLGLFDDLIVVLGGASFLGLDFFQIGKEARQKRKAYQSRRA